MEIQNFLTELRIIITLSVMLLLPGWAMLALSGLWRRWDGLQRWIIAVGLSIACYPVLFYGARFAAPWLTLGPYKMGMGLLLCLGMIIWRIRDCWKEQFVFDRLEWMALAIFGMTLFSRFWIIRDSPYPAWTDSLHHAILTNLTAIQGHLPTTLEPYFPIPLEQYHLGLYALTATTQWLAHVPAHTALLWTAQALNGLCGLGVYLVLDRKAGRLGAVVGATVVGLWSRQPSWYVNWGRFTQLSSQTILLIAWLVTWEAIRMWKLPWRQHRGKIVWSSTFAALLTGAMFLLHFRVAAFYLPILALSAIWELWNTRKEDAFKRVLLGSGLIGIITLIFIAPTLWEAMGVYIASKLRVIQMNQVALASGTASRPSQIFYEFPSSSVPYLVAQPWLLWVAGGCVFIGLLKRNKLTVAILGWVIVLYLMGMSYLLKIPFITFTNLGAILVMLYLPLGLVVGLAVETMLTFSDSRWRKRAVQIMIALTFVTAFIGSHIRATDVEPYRYFVTPEDVEAMQWINKNTPEDAVFAVNTHFWLPQMPHGTDAGYWIPYFTGRKITAGVMLLSLGSSEYRSRIVEISQLVERLGSDPQVVSDLQIRGVDYIYIGQRGDFSELGLNAEQLSQVQGVKQLYRNGKVTIFQISSADDTFIE
ncbi:MAG: hypothetical protein WHX52_13580 [Anaerolineae bacterium]